MKNFIMLLASAVVTWVIVAFPTNLMYKDAPEFSSEKECNIYLEENRVEVEYYMPEGAMAKCETFTSTKEFQSSTSVVTNFKPN